MSITRPPFVGPNKPVNPNDADAVEAEKNYERPAADSVGCLHRTSVCQRRDVSENQHGAVH